MVAKIYFEQRHNYGSLRISLGEDATEEQIDYIIKSVTEVVTYLRNMSPFWRDLVNGKRPHVFKEYQLETKGEA